jgi:hypothetical protein
MSDKHAENKKLFALGKAVYGDDEKWHWQYINTRDTSDTWGGTGHPPRWIGECEYRRKPSAPKLPDGDCSDCPLAHPVSANICAACNEVNPEPKQPEPTKGFVLCCDCDLKLLAKYHEDLPTLNGIEAHQCTESDSIFYPNNFTGCPKGTPKPKMLSINGYEFPEPVSETPQDGEVVYFAHVISNQATSFEWNNNLYHRQWLDMGLIHLTEQGAEQQLAAILAACRGEVK